MGRCAPISLIVATVAQGRGKIIHGQKLPILVIMGLVATSTLELARCVQSHWPGQDSWVFELAIGRSQGGVVNKGDGVVVREIRAQKTGSRRQGSNTATKRYYGGRVSYLAQGYGAVMAT